MLEGVQPPNAFGERRKKHAAQRQLREIPHALDVGHGGQKAQYVRVSGLSPFPYDDRHCPDCKILEAIYVSKCLCEARNCDRRALRAKDDVVDVRAVHLGMAATVNFRVYYQARSVRESLQRVVDDSYRPETGQLPQVDRETPEVVVREVYVLKVPHLEQRLGYLGQADSIQRDPPGTQLRATPEFIAEDV
ncbi:MAG: hypothetical protein WDO68_21465 [Gammaproteobacteria bacterium]